jgi:hypothetical protein
MRRNQEPSPGGEPARHSASAYARVYACALKPSPAQRSCAALTPPRWTSNTLPSATGARSCGVGAGISYWFEPCDALDLRPRCSQSLCLRINLAPRALKFLGYVAWTPILITLVFAAIPVTYLFYAVKTRPHARPVFAYDAWVSQPIKKGTMLTAIFLPIGVQLAIRAERLSIQKARVDVMRNLSRRFQVPAAVRLSARKGKARTCCSCIDSGHRNEEITPGAL